MFESRQTLLSIWDNIWWKCVTLKKRQLCEDDCFNAYLVMYLNVLAKLSLYLELGLRVAHKILARGAGGPHFAPCNPVRLTSPSLAMRRRLQDDLYNFVWRPAWLSCS